MSRLQLHDVGLRDGLKMEETQVPFDAKMRWLRALIDAGVDIIITDDPGLIAATLGDIL